MNTILLFQCYESPRKTTLYATFRPVRRPEVRTHPVIQAQLELKPAGYHLFDDILVSALIMARCRAMPQDNNDQTYSIPNGDDSL